MDISNFAMEDCQHADEKVERWIQDICFENISFESVKGRLSDIGPRMGATPSFDSLSKLFADRTNISSPCPLDRITWGRKRKREEGPAVYPTASRLTNMIQQSLIDLKDTSIKSICKHGVEDLKDSKLAIFPRSFQHHRISGRLRNHYSFQNWRILKNKHCAESPCGTLMPGDMEHSWVDYKYIKINLIDEADNEILCRFCYGKNWVKCTNFFRHIFLSHGISTKLEISGHEHNVPLNVSNVFKNWKDIAFEFIPLPKLYFCMRFSTGLRRTHVQCPNCDKWIRLSWCEHDEILVRDMDSTNTKDFDDFNVSHDARYVYIQNRDRSLVDGFYENYFSHYVTCDQEKYNHNDLFIRME